MHKRVQGVLMVFVVAVASSCAVPKYESPREGVTTTLEITSLGKMNAFSYGEASTCTHRKMILSTKDPAGMKKVVNIPTGEPFTLTLAWDTGARFSTGMIEFIGCAPTVMFVPEVGRTYVAGLVDKRQCALYLHDDQGRAVEFTAKQWKTGLSESSSFCR